MLRLTRILVLLVALMLLQSCDIFDSNNGSSNHNGDYTEEILFIRYHDGVSELCVMGIDSSNLRILLSVESGYSRDTMYDAAWSSDKSLIALNGGPNQSQEYPPIWLLNSEGQYLSILAELADQGFWKDDHIVCYHHPYGGYHCVDVNTLEDEPVFVNDLTDSISYILYDFYEADTWLATATRMYTTPSGGWEFGNNDIVLLDILTEDRTYLTDTYDLNESCPKLSPDKSKVLFRAPSNGVGYPINIYITEIAGLNPQQATFFTEVNQYQTFPVRWGPYSDAVAFTNPDPMVNYPPDPGPFLDIFAVDLNTGIIDTLSNWSGENISSYIADWK